MPIEMTWDGVNWIDSIVDGPHGPIPVRHYSPPSGISPVSTRPIVWIRGGGFFKGNLEQPESHDAGRALAAAGFHVITVAYQLATVSRHRWFTRGLWWSPAVHYPIPVDEVVVRSPGRATRGPQRGNSGRCKPRCVFVRRCSASHGRRWGQHSCGRLFSYGLSTPGCRAGRRNCGSVSVVCAGMSMRRRFST